MARLSTLTPEFYFAGFAWPRHIARMPKRFASIAERNAYPCGEYYHAPKPNSTGKGFYLESDGMPALRWQWCDKIDGANIEHTGWFADADGYETVRGIVFRLPHGRGFLVGWSMGENMASEIDYSTVYADEIDAARAADSMAESFAESEREYNERWQEAREVEEETETALHRLRECIALRHRACMAYVRDEISELVATIRANRERLSTEFADVL